MAFFSGLKKMFDSGGIKVKIDAPKKFRWSDADLPVTVTLTGSPDEPRTVTSLEFTLGYDEVDPDKARPMEGNRTTFVFDGPFQLAAGQSIDVDVRIPLALTDPLGSVEAKGVKIAFGGLQGRPSESQSQGKRFKLVASTNVEGVRRQKSASTRIDHAGGFSVSLS